MFSRIQKAVGTLLLFVAVGATPTIGQEHVRRMSLDEAVRLFNENNLALRHSRSTSMAVAGAAQQLMAYPNPTASVTHESVSDQSLSYSETYYTLTQPIDWPWRYGDRRKVGARRTEAASAELRADSAQLLFELKAAYVEAATAEGVWEVLSQVAEVFRRADQNAAARLEEGDISSFELKRIRIERSRYEQRWMEMELELARFRRRLAALTVPDHTVLQVAPSGPLSESPPAVSTEQLLDRALARRGEIAAVVAATAAARAAASVASWSRLPNPAITGGYKRQSDAMDGLFLGLALPLPLWDRKGGDVAATAARVEGAELQEQLTHLNVSNDVTATVEHLHSFESRATLIGVELLSDVDDLLDVALISYGEGELTLLELLDAAEAYSEAGVTKLQLNAAHWIAYYDLERAVGGLDVLDSDGLEDK